MKKILITSAFVFGILCACQKPLELDNLENSKPNNSRSAKEVKSAKEQNFEATLIAINGDKDKDGDNKLFDEFPQAEEIYASNLNSNIQLNFLTVSVSNIHEPVRGFSFDIVQDYAAILNNIKSKYEVCSSNNTSQIQCITPEEMQSIVYQAFVNNGYNVVKVDVSENGNIIIKIRNPDATLASCIATVISYFN